MASIEAAVEHVKSGAMSNSTAATPISIDHSRFSLPPSSPSKSGSEPLWQKIDASDHENTPAVDILFQVGRNCKEWRVQRRQGLKVKWPSSKSWMPLKETMCFGQYPVNDPLAQNTPSPFVIVPPIYIYMYNWCWARKNNSCMVLWISGNLYQRKIFLCNAQCV